MRWVLIRPRNHSPYYDPEIQEPLGLQYLAASRLRREETVLLLDATLENMDDRKLARRAAAFRPDAVGFSLTTAQELGSVREIHAECLRALDGRPCRWLAGGNFISTEPQYALRHLPDEFILVRFEGEQAMDELVRSWGRGPTTQDGGISTGRLCEGAAIENLDTLPLPARPFAEQVLSSGWAFNLQGSRGCCGACRYCSSPGMLGAASSRWRGRSPGHIVEEIAVLEREFGARSFNFVDEDFLGPPAGASNRAEEFARELSRRGLHVTFSIQVRPASLRADIIDVLVDSGLVYVFMGIESDSPEDFRYWHRPWTESTWQFVAQLSGRGVALNAGVLMFHQHATLDGIRRFANKLHEYRLLEYRSARNRLDAMPGSHFYTKGVETGQLDAELPGPQPLPFIHRDVEAFYTDLLPVLEPLGVPSMHALCALPPLLAARRFDPRADTRCRHLEAVISRLDGAVASSFFSLLDSHQQVAGSPGISGELLRRNFDIALEGARELAASGFAESFDALRDAIRIDSGM